MGAGLQVFNESGGLSLDLTKRPMKVLGRKEISGNGEISLDEYPGMRPWYLTETQLLVNEEGAYPVLCIDNASRKILWRNLGTGRTKIIYGVY